MQVDAAQRRLVERVAGGEVADEIARNGLAVIRRIIEILLADIFSGQGEIKRRKRIVCQRYGAYHIGRERDVGAFKFFFLLPGFVVFVIKRIFVCVVHVVISRVIIDFIAAEGGVGIQAPLAGEQRDGGFEFDSRSVTAFYVFQ